MAVALKAKPLPTTEQMRKAVDAARVAEERLERLVWDLPENSGHGVVCEPITYAYIGELFDAYDYLRMSSNGVAEKVVELFDRLSILTAVRAEQGMARGEAGS